MAIFLALAETDAQEDAHEQAVQTALDFCKAALDAASEYDPSDSVGRMYTCTGHINPLFDAKRALDAVLVGHKGRQPHAIRACKAIIRSTRRACDNRIENARRAHRQAGWSR